MTSRRPPLSAPGPLTRQPGGARPPTSPRQIVAALSLALALGALPPPAVAHPEGEDPRRTPVVIAVERATPAVVAIEVEQSIQSPFALLGAYSTTSEGSGVIIHADGTVLTNAHVVDGASAIRVHAADGRSFDAALVGMEADLDLAVLRLEGAEGLPTAKIGTASDLIPGEPLIAIGNPYGLGLTVSTGVVASAAREVAIQEGIYQTYVQTDAAINPGNSGGALININGELVGINTAIHAAGEGIGFAIPVDRAWKVAQDLVTYGSLRAPWLGIGVDDIHPSRLQGTPLEAGAVVVRRVYRGSPAAEAGLEPGDLLYQTDGRSVHSRADLNAFLAERSPGATIRASIYRGAEPLEIALGSSGLPDDLADAVIADRLGVGLKSAGGGLLVSRVEAGGTWAQARLRVGDLLVAVDGQPVSSQEQVRQAIGRALARHSTSVLVTVRRGRIGGTVSLSL